MYTCHRHSWVRYHISILIITNRPNFTLHILPFYLFYLRWIPGFTLYISEYYTVHELGTPSFYSAVPWPGKKPLANFVHLHNRRPDVLVLCALGNIQYPKCIHRVWIIALEGQTWFTRVKLSSFNSNVAFSILILASHLVIVEGTLTVGF